MAALDFKEAFDLHWANHQKVWKHDRNKTLGASEVFGCLRKAWYGKNNTPKDPDYKNSWGALKRGDVIEEHHVEPAIRWYLEHKFPVSGARYTMGGKKQRTFIDPKTKLSATPDGLIIGADDDALAKYGVPSLGGSGCFNFEIKSIDPRVNLREEKMIHRGQTIVQMGLTREQTIYKPNFAVICYVDCSFFDDIDVFIVPYDHRSFLAAKERATSVFTITSPADIMAEGKIDGGCDYCPYKIACAKTSKLATPTTGEASGRNLPPALMDEASFLLSDEREKSWAKKDAEAAHKEASERLKQWLREMGVRTVVTDEGVKATISWSKGRKSLDRKAMEDDGIDLKKYEKEGEGFDTLRISEKGPTGSED